MKFKDILYKTNSKKANLTVDFMIDGSADNYEEYKNSDLMKITNDRSLQIMLNCRVAFLDFDNKIVGLFISNDEFNEMFSKGIKELNI